jgi:hypothetical protein
MFAALALIVFKVRPSRDCLRPKGDESLRLMERKDVSAMRSDQASGIRKAARKRPFRWLERWSCGAQAGKMKGLHCGGGGPSQKIMR